MSTQRNPGTGGPVELPGLVEPRWKYPRTPHLPTSPGWTSDDVRAGHDTELRPGLEIVLTEKLDGECTTIYRDGMHARSVNSGYHPSRDRALALTGELSALLPPGMRINGENVYARHSVTYTELPGYLCVFGIWIGPRCLSWDETEEWCGLLGLPTVPVVWRGPMPADLGVLEAHWRDRCGGEERSEGFVVRDAAAFTRDQFSDRVAKWVRRGHVQTGNHWMHTQVVPNALATAGPETPGSPEAPGSPETPGSPEQENASGAR